MIYMSRDKAKAYTFAEEAKKNGIKCTMRLFRAKVWIVEAI